MIILANIDDSNIFSNFENHILSILKHLKKDNLYFISFIAIISDFFLLRAFIKLIW